MRFLKEQIDCWAIKAAAKSLPCLPANPLQADEVKQLLLRPDLFLPPEKAPSVELKADYSFQFSSTVRTPFDRNNFVHGRIFPAGKEWKKRPSVVMVHGWNAEMHYTSVLPHVARNLNKHGLNGVAIELPYHLHRRPFRGEAVTNFISENIPRMLEATAQAIADLNAVLHWLKSEGNPATALWGFSLGGWLAGLHLCLSSAQDAAVLTTPVSNLERAVHDLDFCHPIRAALKVAPSDLTRLNLRSWAPKISPDRIRLMEAKHDRFVPSESYRELASAWNIPGWDQVPQSHISILLSPSAMSQSIQWLARRFG